jgi:hypothetical protein
MINGTLIIIKWFDEIRNSFSTSKILLFCLVYTFAVNEPTQIVAATSPFSNSQFFLFEVDND